MRTFLLLPALLLAACGGGSGSPAARGVVESAFTRFVEGSNSVDAILPLDDGSTVVIGVAPSGTASFVDPGDVDPPVDLVGDRFMLCYDADGDLLWHKSFSEEPRWLDLAGAPDGTIVALVAVESAVTLGSFDLDIGAFNAHYYRVRLSRSGEILSADSAVQASVSNPMGRFAIGADGSMALLVRRGPYSVIAPGATDAGGGQTALVRYDAAGNRLWYRLRTESADEYFAMLPNGDVVGHLADDGAGVLFRYDPSGTEQAAPAVAGSFEPRALAGCAEGYLLSASHYGELSIGGRTFPGEGCVLVRIDGTGEVAWAEEFPDGTSFGSLAAAPDGTLIVAGGAENAATRRDGLLLLYDDRGNRLQRIDMPGTEWLNVTSAWSMPGGDLGLLGEANGPSTIDIPGAQLAVETNDVLFLLRMR